MIALYIFVGLLGLMAVAALVIILISVIEQRRTPLEARIEQVKQELRKRETPTGATSILSGFRIGVSDEMVRDAADAEGYQWAGYTALNDRQLNFQRKLQPSVELPPKNTGARIVDEFLAKLANLQPDLGGTARINMSDIPHTEWRNCRALLGEHGWAYDTTDIEQRTRYWVVKRAGTVTVSRQDPFFIKGPSIDELRRYPEARQAAKEAERDLGVDPLSDAALREVRARHLSLLRRAQRRMGLAVVCGLTLLVVVVTAARHFDNPVVLVSVVVLLLGTVIGGVLAHREMRERKAAVKPFEEAYERVVAAVLKRPD